MASGARRFCFASPRVSRAAHWESAICVCCVSVCTLCVCVCSLSVCVCVCYILDAFEIHLSLIACSNWYESVPRCGRSLFVWQQKTETLKHIEQHKVQVFLQKFSVQIFLCEDNNNNNNARLSPVSFWVLCFVSVSWICLWMRLRFFLRVCSCVCVCVSVSFVSVAYALPKNNERHKRTRSGEAAAAMSLSMDVAIGCYRVSIGRRRHQQRNRYRKNTKKK